MSKSDLPKDLEEELFALKSQMASQKLLTVALTFAETDPMMAVASLAMAAAHAAAMAKLPLSLPMNLFASQYEIMVEYLKKREAEGAEITEEIPTSPAPRKSN